MCALLTNQRGAIRDVDAQVRGTMMNPSSSTFGASFCRLHVSLDPKTCPLLVPSET